MTDDLYKKLAEIGDADRFFRDGQQSARVEIEKRATEWFAENEGKKLGWHMLELFVRNVIDGKELKRVK